MEGDIRGDPIETNVFPHPTPEHSGKRSPALSDRSMDNRRDFRRDSPCSDYCPSPKPDYDETKTLALSGRSMDNRRDFKCDPPGNDCCSGREPDTRETLSLAQSGRSMDNRRDFKSDHQGNGSFQFPNSAPREDPDSVGSQRSPSQLDQVFMHVEERIMTFVKEQLQSFHQHVAAQRPDSANETEEQSTGTLSEGEEQSCKEAVLHLTLTFLERMDQEHLAKQLRRCNLNHTHNTEVKALGDEIKMHLRQRCHHLSEGVATEGERTPLNQIYTELYITQGQASEINQEHEVRHIEMASRKKADIPISCEDIFKHRSDSEELVRTVLTKGVAGVGKTVLTQKFILDWAEGKSNQDIELLFPFTFRELNVLKERKYSLMGLLCHFFTAARELSNFQQLQVLFIFDGMDECRLHLDFLRTRPLTDPTEPASVEVLLVNIIRGSLLPNARLWITTRPAAASQIPAKCISIVTEVRGFTNSQKEQYFKKRISNKQQAKAVLSHIRSIRSLYIMSHLPIFCWLLATVILRLMETTRRGLLPHTLTQMYIRFLVIQAKIKNIKYHDRPGKDFHWTLETRKMVLSLAKLAFEQLQKGNLIFYESDLKECGLDVAAASLYSGVFTQFFREELGLYQDKVYCFIHLTVQEFLAALHVHYTFTESGINLLEEQKWYMPNKLRRKRNIYRLHRCAVDKALQSPNGHLDMFLRFLLGLSLPTNQKLLSGLLPPQKVDLTYKAVWYIMQRMNERSSAAGRTMNLLNCLYELDNHNLVEHIQSIMNTGGLDQLNSPAQWSALSFIILSSDLEEFDLRRYHSSENALLNLLPVVKASNKAILSGCGLSYRSCRSLASVLSSSSLTHLDISNNDLQDSGVELLCEGLRTAFSSLHTLHVSSCGLSPLSCAPLASVLKSSRLIELDLSDNDLQDSGIELLTSAGLKSTLCRLQILKLSGCLISEKGGTLLASAVSTGHSCLRELDLKYNNPGHSAKILTARQDNCDGPLVRLDPRGERFMVAGLRKYSCEFLLDKNTAHRKLALSKNKCIVSFEMKKQEYPPHEDRFTDFCQILASTGLRGRCYWEVEWINRNSALSATVDESVTVAVSYREIKRNGGPQESRFGENKVSWGLRSLGNKYFICHNATEAPLGSHSSHKVGVFLDTEAGVLSFYLVQSDGQLSHLHTILTSFTEPLFPGFELGPGMKVTLKSPSTVADTK